ncbi:hypothetical protein SYNPS1DRAFT_23217 [Syncephalis pseudoplumigaleata]|uniref:Uncharacterized protein n=1 Tax=Syncephalis pseudoplumigaleata TaxID=1712513 RepID=A0A4P9YXI7_9FUNG|nr:hypothetical protein SYNPS1DRAFT_23217 [Syncephalis pseudoplumigaleata]|eukprot:RKP24724.1 hypothetical protein SYNPS1DRAFT_23217 [Syncephalis pseudoplumigaleata]
MAQGGSTTPSPAAGTDKRGHTAGEGPRQDIPPDIPSGPFFPGNSAWEGSTGIIVAAVASCVFLTVIGSIAGVAYVRHRRARKTQNVFSTGKWMSIEEIRQRYGNGHLPTIVPGRRASRRCDIIQVQA